MRAYAPGIDCCWSCWIYELWLSVTIVDLSFWELVLAGRIICFRIVLLRGPRPTFDCGRCLGSETERSFLTSLSRNCWFICELSWDPPTGAVGEEMCLFDPRPLFSWSAMNPKLSKREEAWSARGLCWKIGPGCWD